MKKKIFLWTLYDFANSILLMAFLFYFSQWLVIDQGKPAWWYNGALIASSALFILTAPYVSKKIDATKKKIGGLRFWTILTFLLHALVALLTILTSNMEILITLLYILATYVYLLCFLYHTPMLMDLSTDKNRPLISGIGQAGNSVGQVVGVLVALPFVNGLTLFGDPGRAQALLPGVIIFGIFALPLLIWYKENPVGSIQNLGQKTNLFAVFKEVFSYRSLGLLLIAYFLYVDALLTFANNFPLYLEVVHGVSDTTKSLLTASILILAALGAVIFGKIAHRKGELRTLKFIVTAWAIILPCMAFIPTFKLLVPLFLVAGLIFGPAWSVSKSLIGRMTPEHITASSFSFYTVAERFATFIGPALWSIALVVVGDNAKGYKAALVTMAVLMLASLIFIKKIKDPQYVLRNE